MAKLSTIQVLARVTLLSVGVGILFAPGCSVSSGDDDGEEDGGAGNEGGKASTGGTSATAGETGEGGSSAEAGASPGSGGAGLGSGGAGGGDTAGAGGQDPGRTCETPDAEWTSARGRSCATYCADLFSTCGAYIASADVISYSSLAECQDSCDLFDQDQLCCRAFNAAQATSSNDGRCAYANGDAWAGGAGGASSGTQCN